MSESDSAYRQPVSAALPTRFAYGRFSRLAVALLTAALSVPLVYVLAFLVTHPPSTVDVGPTLIILLFLLAPPIFAWLRYGHYFRQYEVQPRQLVVRSLWQEGKIEWREVARIVRRFRRPIWGGSSYKVRLRLESATGKPEWIDLFDSALPGADALYAQVVRHAPHVRPKEIDDELPPRGRL